MEQPMTGASRPAWSSRFTSSIPAASAAARGSRKSRSSPSRAASLSSAGDMSRSSPSELLSLDGKTAVVTGGAKGIGAATTKLFEKAGAKVEVLDIERGHDVTKEKTVRDAYADIEKRCGAIDILVNNAGTAIRKSAVQA